MTAKEPVLLVVLIEHAHLRWYVAGISLAGVPLPLLKSEAGNLRPYIGVSLDEQVTFLRHRLSGVLQRGCDRLWGRQQKPCHVVFLADGPFPEAPPELTVRVAEHFVEWLNNPPVAFFTTAPGFSAATPAALSLIAGELDDGYRDLLVVGLAALREAFDQPNVWELSPSKPPVPNP